MHTTLYTTLDEARTWAKARGVVLNLSMTVDGGLLLQGYKAAAKKEDPPEVARWEVSAGQMLRAFAVGPVVKLGSVPKLQDQLGLWLKTVMAGPLGLLRFATILQNDADPLTQAILAQAAFCRSEEAAGREVDPWAGVAEPKPLPPAKRLSDLLKPVRT